MQAASRTAVCRDIRLLESIVLARPQRCLDRLFPTPLIFSRSRWLPQTQCRGAKTVSRKKVKELQQGPLEPTVVSEVEDDGVPQYPSVLQGVKNNIAKFEGCVVLTRVGNFYELYFEQAEEFGPLLNLKVADRRVGSKKTGYSRVPMAGFPFFQLDRFLKILVQDLNKYVAISEEFPATSGDLLFDRRVARVVTPGTLIDEKFLNPYENNFLLSLTFGAGGSQQFTTAMDTTDTHSDTMKSVGLAWLDLSTGDFFTQTATVSSMSSAITRVGAKEIILPSDVPGAIQAEIQKVSGHDGRLLTLHNCTTSFTGMSEWNGFLETPMQTSSEFQFSMVEKLAGHQLLDYVRSRLQDLQLQLRPPRRREMSESLAIDRSSLRGLEILETARDGLGKGSLFHAVRRTATKSGARLLRDRLTSPSASLPEIDKRLDLVTMFHRHDDLRELLVYRLRRLYDVQRLVQKFALNKGDADDMLCLARAIMETSSAHGLLMSFIKGEDSKEPFQLENQEGSFSSIRSTLDQLDLEGPTELGNDISNAIDEDGLIQQHQLEEDEAAVVAGMARDVVLQSAPEQLDELPKAVRAIRKSTDVKDVEQEWPTSEPWIMRRDASETLSRLHDRLIDLQQEKSKLNEELKIKLSAPTLVLKWTPGLGHICHIRSANGFNKEALEQRNAKMVSSSKSTRSFYLTDWSRLGSRLEQAKVNIRNEEQRIFSMLRSKVIQNLVKLRRNAAVMDELDVASSFAALAKEQAWVRPIVDTGLEHKIIAGRHPTVKLGLEEQGRSFVSNGLHLGREERIWLVTGPNMAGKSTFLRQNALITILAQVGSYVPAEHAEIGLVDQIFSRIGAADDLFRDQSTFMVEMLETAAILKHATSRSFVIMDEVGRGTTPEDGIAIGYACLDHLNRHNKCRTLFATHFHSLADMTADWQHLACYCTDVLEEDNGSFTFVHRLKRGVNRNSHALKVAKLAGVPDSVLRIAQEVATHLQQGTNVNWKDDLEREVSDQAAAAGS